MPRGNDTNASEGVAESFATGGAFLKLESIARRQADERVVGAWTDKGGDGMVRVQSVDELFGREELPKERTKFYPSQLATFLLKDFFQINLPTHLYPSDPTTSISADQMIQFASAVGLEMSLTSYSMLEDLFLKARGSGWVHAMTSRYPAGKSPFPSVAGSSMGDSIASRSVYSLSILTETEGTNFAWVGLCWKNRVLVDKRMLVWLRDLKGVKNLELTVNKSNEKKKWRLCEWSRKGRLTPLLPSGDDKGGYISTEDLFELDPLDRVFAKGFDNPLEIKFFHCMLYGRIVSMRTRGMYKLKRQYQRGCHFRTDQRNTEKRCPGKARGRDGRVLYGSKLEAERELYME